MSDLLDQEHADAGLNLLLANSALGPTRVFDGRVPDPTPDPPYIVVYTTVSWTREGIGTALNGTQVTITTTWNCRCVGLTAAAARAMAMQVRSSLLNQRPVIPGRNCGPIKQWDDPMPAQRDESTGRLVMDEPVTYGFISTG